MQAFETALRRKDPDASILLRLRAASGPAVSGCPSLGARPVAEAPILRSARPPRSLFQEPCAGCKPNGPNSQQLRSRAVFFDSVDFSKFLQKLRIAKIQACNFTEL